MCCGAGPWDALRCAARHARDGCARAAAPRRRGTASCAAAPRWRAAASPLLRLLRALLALLLLAPACRAQAAPALRADVVDVAAFNFSAAVRAAAAGRVAYVVWLAADAAAAGAPAAADVWEGLGPDGLKLDESRAGSVLVVRPGTLRSLPRLRASLTRLRLRVLRRQRAASVPATLRAGPGLSSETDYTLWLTPASLALVVNASVRTLDVTPPAFAAGAPRVAAAGAAGAAFVVALNEPGAVAYLLMPPDAPPPTLADVRASTRHARITRMAARARRDATPAAHATRSRSVVTVPLANVPVTEYILAGIEQDSLYVLYLAASDAVVPTPNVKARRAQTAGAHLSHRASADERLRRLRWRC